jgi:hypothetical protein
MKTFFKTILAAAAILGSVDGRRHLDDTSMGRRHPVVSEDSTQMALVGTTNSPLVQGTDCTLMCLFKDTHNSFCWKFQSPMLEAGYDWSQSQGTGYW